MNRGMVTDIRPMVARVEGAPSGLPAEHRAGT
jgi:hypothetical protein